MVSKQCWEGPAPGAIDKATLVIRFALVQLSTPNEMRGRVGAVNFLFINTSNQLGQSGVTAALFGTIPQPYSAASPRSPSRCFG